MQSTPQFKWLFVWDVLQRDVQYKQESTINVVQKTVIYATFHSPHASCLAIWLSGNIAEDNLAIFAEELKE